MPKSFTDRLPEDVKWYEKLYARKQFVHGYSIPFRIEDLLKAEVLGSNLNLRQEAFVATHRWPVREKAIAALKKYYAPKPKPPVDLAARRAKHLATLLAKQKNWQRKAKLANTKLRKLRTAIKRIRTLNLEPSNLEP